MRKNFVRGAHHGAARVHLPTHMATALHLSHHAGRTLAAAPRVAKAVSAPDVYAELPRLLEACRRNDRRAQRALYERFTPTLFAVALRYVRHRETAQDVLAEAWVKAFGKLASFSGSGSFEGWLKRICTNEALMHLRKRRLRFDELPEYGQARAASTPTIPKALESETVDALLDALPEGCRTVFNLYEIEGYKHREIAELLDVSINTSKSQLILAKRKLREAYAQLAAREGRGLRHVPKHHSR